jgi:hypothetical protein
MITVFDAKNYAQQWLFEKAFASLKNKGMLNEDEIAQGRFLSLDGYFAHMADLIGIDSNYVMIPTDEKPFEINANNRTITVPADFSKCAGIAGDAMCEIITFTIDRYFDYVDLANTHICIQWVTPDKREGISHISLIDTETISGKIRFGWPLTEDIASVAGNVNFAVRFFTKDAEGKVVYLFNTLTASLPIKQGLQLVNPTEEANAVSIFKDFIKNSNNPSYPIPSPIFFGAPGKNLKTQASIGADNTLTLEGQAIVEDNGYIQYQWYFLENDTETAIKVENDSRFEVKDVYKLIDGSNGRDGSEQYYTKAADAEAYTLVVSKDLPDTDLYERYTTLTIKDSDAKNVTGQYWFGATNYIGSNEVVLNPDNSDEDPKVAINAINYTNETYSNKCLVPFPVDVVIDALPENQFIEDKNTLKAVVNEDSGNPIREYTWYRDEVVISGETDETCDAIIPGYYSVSVKSILNRTEKESQSNVCRVLNLPEVPAVKLLTKGENEDDYVDYIGDMDLKMGAIVSLKVELVDSTFANNELKSDELLYRWYVAEPEKSARLLTSNDIGVDKILVPGTLLDTDSITVCKINGSDSVYSFFCEIENKLVNKSATSENPERFIIK